MNKLIVLIAALFCAGNLFAQTNDLPAQQQSGPPVSQQPPSMALTNIAPTGALFAAIYNSTHTQAGYGTTLDGRSGAYFGQTLQVIDKTFSWVSFSAGPSHGDIFADGSPIDLLGIAADAFITKLPSWLDSIVGVTPVTKNLGIYLFGFAGLPSTEILNWKPVAADVAFAGGISLKSQF